MRALAVILLLGLATTAHAQDAVTVIAGGRVVPIAGSPIDDGVVVLRGERIAFVGRTADLPAEFAGGDVTRVDAAGRVVMPGLVAPFTQLGLVEIGMVKATNDHDESVAPMTPHVHALDGINVSSSLFRVTRMNGVTTALSAPSEGNLVSGRSCVIALDGETAESMLRLPHAALHASLGTPPMRRFGERDQAPSTRMGEVAMLRAALVAAREYAVKQARPPKEDADPPTRDLEKDAWLPILAQERPLFVRAQRVSDIEAALRIAKEFEIRVVIVRGAEAWKLADRIAAAGIPVVYGPMTQDPRSVETLGARPDSPALLLAAGVRVALTSADAHNVRNLPFYAGLAMAHGLAEDAALRAVTLTPAEILGVADRVGSLEAGKDADVVLLDGPIYQPRTRVLRVWIRGSEVALTSRQTELGDHYR